MHVDRELVEFMPVDEQEYDEVIEEYEEEILMQEGAPEPFGADLADPVHNPYFNDHWIYIYDVHLSYRHFIETTSINIPTHESYKHRSSSFYAQDIGSVSNLSLLANRW